MNAAKDFSTKTRKALAAKGFEVIGATAAPAFEGDRCFSGVVYRLVYRPLDQLQVKTFQEVLDLAG